MEIIHKERALATVRIIDEIRPIEGADAIECAMIGGWPVVVKKNEHVAGDKALYLEIDSWVPKDIAPFLFEGKSFNGVEGARLRTVKLRGQISQGLLLPLSTLPEADYNEWDDVTEMLGIQKWEKPLDPALRGLAKGNFPSFIPKTDQERVQNLKKEITEYQNEQFEITYKLDGSSITVYSRQQDEEWVNGVCSRNLDLQEGDNNFWVVAKQQDLHTKIQSTGRSLAIQAEMLAPNIQGNWEKVDNLCMFVYDVFDIDKQTYLLPEDRISLCEELNIPHVPVYKSEHILSESIEELLQMAEGGGMNKGVKREGLVFKHLNSDFSFKAISNSYLLKNKNA